MKQEEDFSFSSFTNEDAIALGQEMLKIATSQKAPVIVQVRIGQQIIFHAALTGTTTENDWWINRKARVVEKFNHSSMYVRVFFEENNQTFEEHSGLDNELYAAHGGGFPIIVTGQGVVGVALVSGLPQVEDHKMIIQGLTNFKQAKS
ncbi:MAG: heme-degrading domain-containing protein [Actinobacteria bacterium]|nr:heme-degrading domain-containing protein [Actinomycetota bacterium]